MIGTHRVTPDPAGFRQHHRRRRPRLHPVVVNPDPVLHRLWSSGAWSGSATEVSVAVSFGANSLVLDSELLLTLHHRVRPFVLHILVVGASNGGESPIPNTPSQPCTCPRQPTSPHPRLTRDRVRAPCRTPAFGESCGSSEPFDLALWCRTCGTVGRVLLRVQLRRVVLLLLVQLGLVEGLF